MKELFVIVMTVVIRVSVPCPPLHGSSIEPDNSWFYQMFRKQGQIERPGSLDLVQCYEEKTEERSLVVHSLGELCEAIKQIPSTQEYEVYRMRPFVFAIYSPTREATPYIVPYELGISSVSPTRAGRRP